MSPVPILVGGIYLVDDKAITLPPDDQREYHEQRSVVVVSGPATNSDPGWPFVLVVPTSGSTSLKTRFCVKLAAGDGNLTKKCWARVPAVQPFMKADLGDHFGVLPSDKLEAIQVRLVEYLGLFDDAGDASGSESTS